MFSPFVPPSPTAPPPRALARAASQRRAAVAVCLLPLLGLSAAVAALLLNAGPPGPLVWTLSAIGLVAHGLLLRGVAQRAAKL